MNANQKTAAAQAAVEYVKDGMRLGIGTGSTAEEFIRLLAGRVREGLAVRCVATSGRTERICAEQGVEIVPLNDLPQLDLTIDGADEIDPQLNLIKGGGGALLREKIVAAASDRMFVIADSGKLVDCLGRFPLPVEVVPFGLESTRLAMLAAIDRIGAAAEIDLRRIDGKEFVTDSGNWILDASFGRIPDAFALAGEFANIPGVVEHGLFLGMADMALVGDETGVRKLQPKAGPS